MEKKHRHATPRLCFRNDTSRHLQREIRKLYVISCECCKVYLWICPFKRDTQTRRKIQTRHIKHHRILYHEAQYVPHDTWMNPWSAYHYSRCISSCPLSAASIIAVLPRPCCFHPVFNWSSKGRFSWGDPKEHQIGDRKLNKKTPQKSASPPRSYKKHLKKTPQNDN